jgi:two-component system NtrC family response regulator
MDLELADSGAELVPAATLKQARENVERELVEQALKKHSGRISAAATELGISRPTLYELMDKLGISRGDGASHSPGEAGKEKSPQPQNT